MDKKSTLGKFLALSQKQQKLSIKEDQMIHIFTLLAILVSSSAHAGHCDGDLLARLEFVDGTVKTVCVDSRESARAVLTCPCGMRANVRRSYRSGSQRMVDVSCVDYDGAISPSLSISVGSAGHGYYGSRGHHSTRASYGRSGGYYRSVPQPHRPCTEQRVSTQTTVQNPTYQDAVDATYAWRLMDGYVQEARVQADANTGAADRAMSAEAALARERAAAKELEAEYRAYVQEHPPEDIDDSESADKADKEVK